MKSGKKESNITPPLKIFHQKMLKGAPEEGVNCQVFFEITHVRGGG